MEGLVKVVSSAEIAANDWSLTPGRYVGVAPGTDDGEDFQERMAELHEELETLNAQSIKLAKKIKSNFEELLG